MPRWLCWALWDALCVGLCCVVFPSGGGSAAPAAGGFLGCCSHPSWAGAAHPAGSSSGTRGVGQAVQGDGGWLLHWTDETQILALATLEVQFLRIVAWLSSWLQPGVTLLLLSFLSCSWISQLDSDSGQSYLELVFYSTPVSLTLEKHSPDFGSR